MFQFIHEAGFGIIPTLAFGLAALFVGVRQIRSPERRRVTTAAWLIGLTLAAGALGTVTGLQAAAEYIQTAGDDGLFLVGLDAALNNLVAALIISMLTMLCLLVAHLRGGHEPGRVADTRPAEV